MTPEERSLLHHIAEQVEENNTMLHKIRSSMRWESIWRAVYWMAIVGASIGAFWFVQPYINQIMSMYTSAQSNLDSVKNTIQKFSPK